MMMPESKLRNIPESEVISELTCYGHSVADYIIIGDLTCHVNNNGELFALAIDDDNLAVATTAYLRRIGAKEYLPEEYSEKHIAPISIAD